MSTPPPTGRRIVPPSMPLPPAAASEEPAYVAPVVPAVRKNRRRQKRILTRLLLVVAFIIAVAAVWYAIVTNAHSAAVEQLVHKMALAQQDSLDVAGWEGVEEADGTKYVVMSLRDDDAFITEFLKALHPPAGLLLLMVNNQHVQSAHTVDTSGATLYFKDGSTRQAPDHLQELQFARGDADANVDAFPPSSTVAGMELAWGKVIFIPPGTDLRELTAITVKVDGKLHKVGGTYLEAQQKKELRVAEMARHSTTHATAPATAGT